MSNIVPSKDGKSIFGLLKYLNGGAVDRVVGPRSLLGAYIPNVLILRGVPNIPVFGVIGDKGPALSLDTIT